MMNRRSFSAGALSALALAPAGQVQAAGTVTFHFYGAEDCPPCMAFKRDHLADVKAGGSALGFAVEDNVIPRTRDVPNPGVYGDRDPILRAAAPQLAARRIAALIDGVYLRAALSGVEVLVSDIRTDPWDFAVPQEEHAWH